MQQWFPSPCLYMDSNIILREGGRYPTRVTQHYLGCSGVDISGALSPMAQKPGAIPEP